MGGDSGIVGDNPKTPIARSFLATFIYRRTALYVSVIKSNNKASAKEIGPDSFKPT